ncbi:diguanylate cyclase, partial [Pseudomonas aeruginosa]
MCLFDVDKFKNINDTFGHLLGDEVLMKVVKILKSQIPVDKGKVYRFGGDEFAVIYTGGLEVATTDKEFSFKLGGRLQAD